MHKLFPATARHLLSMMIALACLTALAAAPATADDDPSNMWRDCDLKEHSGNFKTYKCKPSFTTYLYSVIGGVAVYQIFLADNYKTTGVAPREHDLFRLEAVPGQARLQLDLIELLDRRRP